MYKFVLTCLLLACTGYYAVEGLNCVDGIGSSITAITNTSKPDTACTGANQRCARTSATVSGIGREIRGVFMQCANQTFCESLKNLATCQQSAIAFVSSKIGFPTSMITAGTCDTACCNTDNCNEQSMAVMRASGSQSATVTTATQPMTPATPPMPPATPPMLPATALMTAANTRTPTTIAGTSGKPPVPTTTGNRQVATVPSMLPNTVNPTSGNAKTTNPLITRVLPSIEWDPSTMIQVSVNPQPATFATGSSSQMEPPNSTDSSVQHKNSTGPSGNRAFESTTSDSSVPVGGFKLCVLIALIAMFNAEL